MNWLAHIFLSEQKIDFQLGSFLADPLKGKTWEGASKDLEEGMKLHKIIDSFTDSNEIVKNSKHSLEKKGLLKSIVIDLTYDYCLTKNWDKYCNTPLEDFTKEFYLNASTRLDSIPNKTSSYVQMLIQRDFLNKYHSLEDLKKSFGRMDARLSQRLLKRDSTSSYYESIEKNIEIIEKDFNLFFPILCQEVKKHINQKNIKHWKI